MDRTINTIRYSNRAWLIALTFTLWVCTGKFGLAQDGNTNPFIGAPDYQNTQTLLSDFRQSRLDYLENEDALINAFTLTKAQNWEALHKEAAALYSELLFRQEKYAVLESHLSHYLSETNQQEQTDIHLLFLESKLKTLSKAGDPEPGRALAKQLEAQIPQHTTEEKIIIFRALAYYYTDTDVLRKTLNAALEGLELAIKNGDIASQGYFYRKIADAYNYLSEKTKAIYYAKKAVDTYENTNDGLFTAKAHWSLGNILLEEEDTEAALVYLNKALDYFKKVDMRKGLAFAQYSIASIQYLQANYDTALTLAKENIELARAAGIDDMQLASMILLSNIYLKQGFIEEAEQVNDDVYSLIDKFSRSIYKAEFLSERYKLKRELNHIDDAFDAIEKKLFYTKKHYEATSESNIKALQIKFEVKEKEDKIRKLEYQKDISNLQAKEEYQQKIIWRLSATIASILVLVVLLLFYRQALQRKKYHRIASTDYLTKSFNRRGILKTAEAKLAQQDMAIAIVDLDYFKKINDEYGHDVGDLVLIAFANAAKDTLSNDDEFGRYGGEEWLFVLHSTDEKVIKNTFEKLAENYQKYCNNLDAFTNNINMTFSVGVSVGDKSNRTLDTLIKRADSMLYEAKENGRNQVIVN
ncbi:tetratricopeptide repeat-containing diguanylate cyclase [Alteromonas sp. CI.11.F.A3]|uniref:tetratricopeptide repeat-containing diguanylate cyclase n=1 Tax=Alteromonas sp. CI.11.F.A3 TaxID=3079555 RepID=UPI002941E13E|nr:tetratricopeptide repeat-containing diguanylate cyclase [Alteromonas sp. CI.11.F.A3]WOI36171.1 tetratricopeptide repeat-containing diguanylate cyclase [Alteromonas sp. CI.11.F.A3]